MSKTTRRAFMAAAGIGLVASSAAAMRHLLSGEPPLLDGTLHALGTPALSADNIATRHDNTSSILVSINIETQTVRYSELPLPNGHSALYIGGDRLLCVSHHGPECLVVDASYKVIKSLRAPNGYVYGGHALVRPNGLPVVYVPLRHEHPTSRSHQGLIAVFDAERIELVQIVPSGGIHPHELAIIPGTRELAVSHYGDLHVAAKPLRHNVVEARLAVLDVESLQVLRKIDVPEYRAMLTHMKVMEDRCAYCVLTQYIVLDNSIVAEVEQVAQAQRDMQRLFSRKFDFSFPPQSRAKGMVAVPLPFLRIDTQTGEREPVMLGDAFHLRSQSVAVNRVLQIAVAAYPHSNTLVLYGTDGTKGVVRGEEIGLPEVRGVSDIPGTTMIAVSSTYRGLSIFDLQTRKLVTHIASKQFDAPHIDYAPTYS